MNGYRGCDVRRRVRGSARFTVLVGIALAALVISGSAAATGGGQTSADDQYGAAGVVKPSEKPKPKPVVLATSAVVTQQPVAAKPTSGSLPFTGISLAGTVVIGLGLAGVGIMLRRRGKLQE